MTNNRIRIGWGNGHIGGSEEKIEITFEDEKPLNKLIESALQWVVADDIIKGWKNISIGVAGTSWVIWWLYQIYELRRLWMVWAFSAQQILVDTWIKGFPIFILLAIPVLWGWIISSYIKKHQNNQILLKEYEIELRTTLTPFENPKHKKEQKSFDWISGGFCSSLLRHRTINLNKISIPHWRHNKLFHSVKKSVRLWKISLGLFINRNPLIPTLILPLSLTCLICASLTLIDVGKNVRICYTSSWVQDSRCEIAKIEYSNDKWTFISMDESQSVKIMIPLSKINSIISSP